MSKWGVALDSIRFIVEVMNMSCSKLVEAAADREMTDIGGVSHLWHPMEGQFIVQVEEKGLTTGRGQIYKYPKVNSIHYPTSQSNLTSYCHKVYW